MMNNLVNNNFEKVKFSFFYIPLFFLVALAVFFSINHAWTVDNYIAVQKDVFFRVNSVLSHYPKWMENLTQLGDALVILYFLSSLLIFTPRISGPLLLGSLMVGVGAHYTVDVAIGGIIGYIAALGGIIINHKCNLWRWISKKQYIALLIVVFLVCCGILFQKIVAEQLPVFYGSFICLCISLYITICRFKDPQKNRIG
ncbi:hypothetical protein [Sphingobacterium sp.]|uniref:hypothetical protein n=1 Tax=Sphingobacterium sp. TaxID=341027 RepID=UPI002899AE81|nr:hypothetical protein [Sphingobacterium sp.]